MWHSSRFAFRPLIQHSRNCPLHMGARFPSLIASHQVLVVVGFCMPDMGDDGQVDRVLVQFFGRCRAPDTATVFEASVFSDGDLFSRRASRVEFAHAGRKSIHIFAIEFHPAGCLTLSPSGPDLTVSQAFLFCGIQCGLVEQQALPLVAFSSTTPPQNNGNQLRVFARAPGKRCISSGEVDMMIEIGA